MRFINYLFGYVLTIAVIIFIPLMIIWSIDQLGGTIDFSASTWVAVMFLIVVFRLLISPNNSTEKQP
jgi:hypothetical protein